MIPFTMQLGPVTVASFLITFREALEAALIIAILVVYLRKIHKAELNRYVWLGSAGAVAGSLLLGVLVLTIYGGLEGPVENLFEGGASITATVVLSYMILWMARNSKRIKGELEQKIDISISTGALLGITVLAFVAVFREGLETVLFLTASFFLDPGETMIGLAMGASVVVALAVLLMRGTVHLPLKTFFMFTSVLLLIFAAGLFGYGVHELIEYGEASGIDIGFLGQEAFNVHPASIDDPLHEKGALGSILKALVGYDANPEWLRVGAYLGYWLVVGLYLMGTYSPSLIPGFLRTRKPRAELQDNV